MPRTSADLRVWTCRTARPQQMIMGKPMASWPMTRAFRSLLCDGPAAVACVPAFSVSTGDIREAMKTGANPKTRAAERVMTEV